MQLHNTANDGQEHVVSYPTWSSSTSHVQCGADPMSAADPANGKYNHWWPSQAYHCTFCPRVFRTAQALGGHMNIHRRERAFANDTGTHRRDSPTNSILSRSSSLPSSLFGGSSHAPSTSRMEHCYANRRIAPAPDSTHSVAKLEDGSSGNNISDPLSWLFSQLPPPGSVTPMQRQQQQQLSRGGNVLMQKNLAKPYHRALAVRRSASSPLSEHQNLLQMRGRASDAEGSRSNGDDAEESLDLELRL